MVELDEMKSCIQEWFADHFHEGVAGIARVYATIISESEKQIEYFSTQFKDKTDETDTTEKLTGMKDKLIERICENCDTLPETRLRMCGECPIISQIREIFTENL